MQPEYLDRLSEPLQEFIREIEAGSGVPIVVIPTPRLNSDGPFRAGALEVVVRARQVLLHAPTNGYFTDGAVRHEVLHVKRCHLDGAPQLVLSDAVVEWDQAYADMLAALDNAIEHLVIVPQELHFHPERREHWEVLMQGVCNELPAVPAEHLQLALCMHWAFLRQALPDSPQAATLKRFSAERGLFQEVDNIASQLLSAIESKEEMVRVLFGNFPQLERGKAGLDYVNSVTGTRHLPIQ